MFCPWDYLESLTFTLQHAIMLCKSMKLYFFGYSPCIIQDGADDLTEESAKMGHIYQNSVCTLVILGAEDSQMGSIRSDTSLRPTLFPESQQYQTLPLSFFSLCKMNVSYWQDPYKNSNSLFL
jgi:hypothetical protein